MVGCLADMRRKRIRSEAVKKGGVRVVNDSTVTIWDAEDGYVYRRER